MGIPAKKMRNIILLFVMLFVGTACQQGGKKSDAQANIERDADEREIPRFNGNEKEHYSYETDPINSIKAMTPEELGPEEKMELKSMKDKIDHAKVSTYHNLRYGYKMKYLNVLVPQEEAESGEGKDFSYNGITLSVWGSNNNLEWDVETAMKMMKENSTYTKVHGNYYVLAGHEDEETLYYTKALLVNDTWYTARLTYPEKFKDIVKPLIQQVKDFNVEKKATQRRKTTCQIDRSRIDTMRHRSTRNANYRMLRKLMTNQDYSYQPATANTARKGAQS